MGEAPIQIASCSRNVAEIVVLAIAHRQARKYPKQFRVALCADNGSRTPERSFVKAGFLRGDFHAVSVQQRFMQRAGNIEPRIE